LRAGVGLHVRMFGAEERLRARDRRALDDVDVFTPSVVAAAWIAFGVLVGEYGAGRLENSAAHEVLRGDELEAVVLAVPLVADGLRHVRIDLGERTPDGWLGFGGHDSGPAAGRARTPCEASEARLFRRCDLIDPALMPP